MITTGLPTLFIWTVNIQNKVSYNSEKIDKILKEQAKRDVKIEVKLDSLHTAINQLNQNFLILKTKSEMQERFKK